MTSLLFKQYNAEGKAVIDSQDNFNSVVTTMIPLGAATEEYIETSRFWVDNNYFLETVLFYFS